MPALPRWPPARDPDALKRASLEALVCALAGVALLLIAWFVSFRVGVFERADQSILSGFLPLDHGHVDSIAGLIASSCDPKPYVCLCAIPVLMALLSRRPRVALTVVGIIFAANATTQLLKPLLAEPRAASLLGGVSPVGPASWPSGHATAAMALALCLVVAAPARLRPAMAALGAAFAVAVSFSFLILGWHYPSDVFGGFLVAATWTMLGLAALFAIDARRPHVHSSGEPAPRLSLRDALIPPAAALLGAVALAGLIALARPHAVIAYARGHEAFLVGAAAIGALSLALATGLVLALRELPGAGPAATGTDPAPRAALRRGSPPGLG